MGINSLNFAVSPREKSRPLSFETAFISGRIPEAREAAISVNQHNDGRRVTVSFHKWSDTFPPKPTKTIIEGQARWTEDDLKRLKLIK
jgi:hypothetical protein